MNIEIKIDPSRARRWHLGLVERLGKADGVHVGKISFGRPSPAAASVELLLTMESLLQRRRRPHASDRIAATGIKPEGCGLASQPDLVVDLSNGDASASGQRVLRPLFDGCASEDALFAALLGGRMPTIEIEDVGSGSIVARGVASGETAKGVGGGLEAITARLITMLIGCAQGRRHCPPGAAGRPVRPISRTSPAYAVTRFAARNLAFKAARALYALCCHTPHWRIGWRFVEGSDVWDRQDLEGPKWNSLPDPGFRFYADPFPFVWKGRTFVFFEDLDHRTDKGVISMIEFDGVGPVGEVRTVLEEAWHLSYPFLYEHDGSVWMIPESSSNRDVAIYRARDFPYRWERHATLLSNLEAGDATVVSHAGTFWMFAATRDGGGGYSDTLSLFSAPDLFGPWTAHAGNPVLIDRATARPAGNIVKRGDRLWRPVQDCTDRYGGGLGLAEILRLDEGGYEQAVRKVLRPGPSWPGRRLHTLNRAGALECIDGSAAPLKVLSHRRQA